MGMAELAHDHALGEELLLEVLHAIVAVVDEHPVHLLGGAYGAVHLHLFHVAVGALAYPLARGLHVLEAVLGHEFSFSVDGRHDSSFADGDSRVSLLYKHIVRHNAAIYS